MNSLGLYVQPNYGVAYTNRDNPKLVAESHNGQYTSRHTLSAEPLQVCATVSTATLTAVV